MTRGLPSREAIMAAGERLIAQHGVDVPLREVALAAGQRNNSAVHYHFGSRDGLVEAIVNSRLVLLETRRSDMLEALDARNQARDVRELVRVLVEPMLVLPKQWGATHYRRFAERVRHLGVFNRRGPVDPSWPVTSRVLALLHEELPISGHALRRRIENLVVVLFALAAEEEEREEEGTPQSSVEEIVSILTAMLLAPGDGADDAAPAQHD